MLRLTGVLGNATDPAIAERLHRLEHLDRVEVITLDPEDTARRRLRVITDRGAECAIILSRDEPLGHGSVLLLEPERAVVVCVARAAWLGLEARDREAALELGYLAGNLHWKVRFAGHRLYVRLDGEPAQYRARVEHLVADARVLVWSPEGPP